MARPNLWNFAAFVVLHAAFWYGSYLLSRVRRSMGIFALVWSEFWIYGLLKCVVAYPVIFESARCASVVGTLGNVIYVGLEWAIFTTMMWYLAAHTYRTNQRKLAAFWFAMFASHLMFELAIFTAATKINEAHQRSIVDGEVAQKHYSVFMKRFDKFARATETAMYVGFAWFSANVYRADVAHEKKRTV